MEMSHWHSVSAVTARPVLIILSKEACSLFAGPQCCISARRCADSSSAVHLFMGAYCAVRILQVDGEPWKQPPSEITVKLHNQVRRHAYRKVRPLLPVAGRTFLERLRVR